jgi:CO/xanthine dehydrogenase FAD-binding subunit
MKAFEVVRASDSREAVALLAEHGAGARVLAGGTDLLVDLKTAADVPRIVVDISRAEDMRQIEITAQGLSIGALVTHASIARSPLIREMFPALVDAALTIGAPQTRNLGTLAGNLATAVPSMDSGPTLLALEAEVTLAGPSGVRQMPLEAFFVGPRRTALGHGELLTAIIIPTRNLGKPAHFLKFGLRKGQALAIVNVAASLWIDPASGTVQSPCIALGAVAPTVVRARSAEKLLDGRPATAETMQEAALAAVADAKPITDFRASAQYRRDLIAVLTRRALEGASAMARANSRSRSKGATA